MDKSDLIYAKLQAYMVCWSYNRYLWALTIWIGPLFYELFVPFRNTNARNAAHKYHTWPEETLYDPKRPILNSGILRLRQRSIVTAFHCEMVNSFELPPDHIGATRFTSVPKPMHDFVYKQCKTLATIATSNMKAERQYCTQVQYLRASKQRTCWCTHVTRLWKDENMLGMLGPPLKTSSYERCPYLQAHARERDTELR